MKNVLLTQSLGKTIIKRNIHNNEEILEKFSKKVEDEEIQIKEHDNYNDNSKNISLTIEINLGYENIMRNFQSFIQDL